MHTDPQQGIGEGVLRAELQALLSLVFSKSPQGADHHAGTGGIVREGAVGAAVDASACGIVGKHHAVLRAHLDAFVRDVLPVHQGIQRTGELALHCGVVGVGAVGAGALARTRRVVSV